ncbi:MAG: hypothetical protein L0G49_05575 [Luteococcus sp.]|uniref:hypothetical protein n=1 Tax=Luteococcus sp. TaxID=1969402 RepID=UPI002648FCE9|nr:hypothetical protein [Luteococcus sp.]MDN5563233.1 hypothetical protein [Luteococcus sp.]
MSRDAWWVARAWLASRGLLLGVALLVMITQHRSGHDLLSAWDVAHFEAIATQGYANPIDRAFFPGLPLLLRGAHTVGIPMGLAGVGIAGICSALAAWALLRLGGPVAASLWLFAPTTVFTTVAYTEAPFCAAAFWAWERARSRHWGQAALLTGLACSFRVSGFFLIGALGLYALLQRGTPVTRRVLHATLMALAALVLFGYVAWLHHLTGSWNAWFEAQQSGWNRGFTKPWEALQHTLDAARPSKWPDRPAVATVFAAEVVSMAVGALLTLVLLVRRRWAQAGWVGVQVFAFATSWWFMSVNRAVLLWFPLWLLAGELARFGWASTGSANEKGSRMLARSAVVVFGAASAAVMLWWAWQFFTGAWAS